MFALLIITRILFLACIVFIIGYVFGNFSKRKALRRSARVAAILLIVLFISMNFLVRSFSPHSFGCPWTHQNENYQRPDNPSDVYHYDPDATRHSEKLPSETQF